MKPVLHFLFSLCVIGQLSAQVVEIPDAKFKQALLYAGVDLNSNGEIEVSEAKQCTQLGISYRGIKDMTGIEAFTNLRTLFMGNNQLKAVHLAYNRKLEILECNDNQLIKLDLSQNPVLSRLYCQTNQISKLDLSLNHYLTDLQCGDNGMDSVIFRNNINLTRFSSFNNPGMVVDFSQCQGLTNLNIANSQLTSLDLSKNYDLFDLDVSNNKLTSLNLKHNTSLAIVYLQNNKLTALDLSSQTRLSTAVLNNNHLKKICINSKQIKDTAYFTKDNSAKFQVCSDFLPFADDNFKMAVLNQGDQNSDGEIDTTEAKAITRLDVSEKNIQSLGGIEGLPNLEYLDFSHNSVRYYNSTFNKKLQFLACNYNHLRMLDATNVPQLKYLYAEHNQLGYVGFAGCGSLQEVHLAYNQINNLVRYSGLLNRVKTFSCHHNPLYGWAFQDFLNAMPNMEYLSCGASLLESLDVSTLSKLKYLYCQKSRFRGFVIDNPKLERFDCSENQLTSLDISNTLSLVDFNARANTSLSSICIDSAQLSLTGTWHKDAAAQWNTCHASFRSEAEETAPVAESFGFFPNPAHSVVHITSTSQNVNVSVLDFHGNELLRTKGEALDVSGLSPGVYFVRIEAGEEQKTHKLIVE